MVCVAAERHMVCVGRSLPTETEAAAGRLRDSLSSDLGEEKQTTGA